MRVMSIKNKTFTYPSSPLLTQGPDVPQEMLCNENEHYSDTSARCRQHNGNTACECVNTRRIPVGSSVEIILIDQGIDLVPAGRPKTPLMLLEGDTSNLLVYFTVFYFDQRVRWFFLRQKNHNIKKSELERL